MKEQYIVFDTRVKPNGSNVERVVIAETWQEARLTGKRLLKIPIEFVNAAKHTIGMIDYDYAPRTGVRRKT